MPSKSGPLRVFIIAGEASGDLLGARLMKALKSRYGNVSGVSFSGVGGAAMKAEGLESLFSVEDISVMGVAEVLPSLGKILKRMRQTGEVLEQEKPDILVTIDSPDFNFRVVRKLRRRMESLPLMVHYVAPTVWAWRPKRAAKIARLYDGLICLFPFEPPYFLKEGLKARFCGHPVLEAGLDDADGGALRARLGIPANAPVLGFFPGSRKGELKRTGPVLRAAAFKTVAHKKEAHILCLTLPHLEEKVRALLQDSPCPVHVVTDFQRKGDVFAALDAAVATSGTIGLELAVAGVPHVIGYRMSLLSWSLIRWRIKAPYAHLGNILLNRLVVPECLQQECTAEKIGLFLEPLLEGATAEAAAQRQAFVRLKDSLRGAGGEAPSAQAAAFILDLYGEKRQPAGL